MIISLFLRNIVFCSLDIKKKYITPIDKNKSGKNGPDTKLAGIKQYKIGK